MPKRPWRSLGAERDPGKLDVDAGKLQGRGLLHVGHRGVDFTGRECGGKLPGRSGT